MNTTTYIGIDYSLGQSNVDKETGIHYGMIAQNSLNPDALEDVFRARDLGYEQAEKELKDKLRSALEDYYPDYKSASDKASRLDYAVDNAFDALDGWADNLESSGPYYYESEETLQTTDNGELWVFKSPYYTYAQFCSPCVPGAGNLDTPCEPDSGAPKTYCLGADWFEDGKAPYRIWRVSDNSEVVSDNLNQPL